MISNIIKKVLLLISTLVCSSAFASNGDCTDERLNGSVCTGMKFGMYVGRTDFKIPTYRDSTLFCDVQLFFNEKKHELTKTKDKKELKFWNKLTDEEHRALEEFVKGVNNESYISVACDSYFDLGAVRQKYRIEKDQMVIDLKLINDSTIGLYNSDGSIIETIKHSNGMLPQNSYRKEWVYWFEGKNFYVSWGKEKVFISSPYKISEDGKTISLILKKEKKSKIQIKNKADILEVKDISKDELKTVDSILVAFGGKAKQYKINKDTIYVNLKNIRGKGHVKKEEGYLSWHCNYDNNVLIDALTKIDSLEPQIELMKKYRNSDQFMYVEPEDTAAVISCVKKHKDLFPKDAVPYFDETNQLILVKKDEPAKVNHTHISDLCILVSDGSFYEIYITLNEEGNKKFAELTGTSMGENDVMLMADRLMSYPVYFSNDNGNITIVYGSPNLKDILESAIKIKLAMQP